VTWRRTGRLRRLQAELAVSVAGQAPRGVRPGVSTTLCHQATTRFVPAWHIFPAPTSPSLMPSVVCRSAHVICFVEHQHARKSQSSAAAPTLAVRAPPLGAPCCGRLSRHMLVENAELFVT